MTTPRKARRTEADRMAEYEVVISEGRSLVFDLLVALQQWEQSRDERPQGSDK